MNPLSCVTARQLYRCGSLILNQEIATAVKLHRDEMARQEISISYNRRNALLSSGSLIGNWHLYYNCAIQTSAWRAAPIAPQDDPVPRQGENIYSTKKGDEHDCMDR